MSTRKSVVLVTVDCMRADHAGFHGYQRSTTPFLDSLAAESFVVPAAIVSGTPTYYSVPAILASRHPLAIGRDLLGVAPDEPTLASVLKQAGYATAAFCAGNPYISARFGCHQGFDVFRDFLGGDEGMPPIGPSSTPGNGWASRLNRRLQELRPRLGPLGSVYDEMYFQYCQRWATPAANSLDQLRRFPAADVMVDQARAWLASLGHGPFFLWLHLMDPHAPYYPAEKALDLMGSPSVTPFFARYLNSLWNRWDLGQRRLRGHREEVVALYDAAIRWVDAQMARLVDTLRRFHRWDDCILAVTADHGEEFLEHEGRFHPPSRLNEELIRVPLLVRVPGAAKKDVSNSPVSLLDLAPTLLEAAQVPVATGFRGTSRWPSMVQGSASGEVAITEAVAGGTNPFRRESRLGSRVLSAREARFKLVLRFDPASDSLYDLDADPHERVPLPTGANKPVRRRLLEIARDHVRQSMEQRDPGLCLKAYLRELRLEWAQASHKASTVIS